MASSGKTVRTVLCLASRARYRKISDREALGCQVSPVPVVLLVAVLVCVAAVITDMPDVPVLRHFDRDTIPY